MAGHLSIIGPAQLEATTVTATVQQQETATDTSKPQTPIMKEVLVPSLPTATMTDLLFAFTNRNLVGINTKGPSVEDYGERHAEFDTTKNPQ